MTRRKTSRTLAACGLDALPPGARVTTINPAALPQAGAGDGGPPKGKAAEPASRMNGLEVAYAVHLESRRLAGEVLRYDFEPEKLRLARATFYTPDFRVVAADRSIEFHECKGGFWEDDARVKIKVAASIHPYRFIAVQRIKGRWVFEDF